MLLLSQLAILRGRAGIIFEFELIFLKMILLKLQCVLDGHKPFKLQILHYKVMKVNDCL